MPVILINGIWFINPSRENSPRGPSAVEGVGEYEAVVPHVVDTGCPVWNTIPHAVAVVSFNPEPAATE